jgi:predicted  nucleic acid-binding Zn-ribbon protein
MSLLRQKNTKPVTAYKPLSNDIQTLIQDFHQESHHFKETKENVREQISGVKIRTAQTPNKMIRTSSAKKRMPIKASELSQTVLTAPIEEMRESLQSVMSQIKTSIKSTTPAKLVIKPSRINFNKDGK